MKHPNFKEVNVEDSAVKFPIEALSDVTSSTRRFDGKDAKQHMMRRIISGILMEMMDSERATGLSGEMLNFSTLMVNLPLLGSFPIERGQCSLLTDSKVISANSVGKGIR